MTIRARLPFHYQFHPAPAYANFGSRKYAAFAAMVGEIAWLLGVDERDLRQVDNSERDEDDELAIIGGAVVGSFWQCPFAAPAHELPVAAE